MPSVLATLPPVYRTLLPTTFERQVPVETKATCATCAMCPEGSEGSGPTASREGVSHVFRPDVKCCTFHPTLPNYLVGGILADEDPALAEGRRRIRARIESRVDVNPLEIRPPATYSLLYDRSRRAFGRSVALRCPYYEEQTGQCTIWRWRDAICSTYYCKFVAGADGRAFWGQVKTYLVFAEGVLARHAAFGLNAAYLLAGHHRSDYSGTISAADLDGAPPSAADYARRWGAWAGREEEFYRACFECVSGLSREDFAHILGADGAIELAVLEERHRAATTAALPESLRIGPDATVAWLADGKVALGAYSDYDAVVVAGPVYAALAQLTGDETHTTVGARLRAAGQTDLDDDLLLALYRQRVLVEP